jgi:hypothetical protein
MRVDPTWAASTAERKDRIKSASRTTHGWRKPSEDKRRGIGGNNPPAYDPDAPVTGFPGVMRDIEPFRLQDGTEITSRSKLREYQSAHQCEQVGVEWTASTDGQGKPWWFEQYKAHRRENEKRRKVGKPTIKWVQPEKPKKKAEKIAVSSKGVHCAKTLRKL